MGLHVDRCREENILATGRFSIISSHAHLAFRVRRHLTFNRKIIENYAVLFLQVIFEYLLKRAGIHTSNKGTDVDNGTVMIPKMIEKRGK